MRVFLITVAVAVAVLILVVWLPTVILRRRHLKRRGSSDAVVRCAAGHLFTTIWIPGVSFKAVRLGLRRYQHCPVGRHWAMVALVSDADLSDEDRAAAARVHDVRIP